MSGAPAGVIDRETAFAKINLALHLRRRRDDGYHEIETLFAFVDDGDVLSVATGNALTLEITGPFASELSASDNLVLDAARILAQASGTDRGAHLTLQKNLPVASGIGGGSADAAAALRLLNRFWKTGLTDSELGRLSADLGADIPACVLSETCVGHGIGQDLEPFADTSLGDFQVLLINPGVQLSTAAVFQAWDGIDRGPLNSKTRGIIMAQGRNDLEDPAIRSAPVISEILSALVQTDPVMARMSGSGATCFALYLSEQQCENAQKAVQKIFPDAWTMVGKLR